MCGEMCRGTNSQRFLTFTLILLFSQIFNPILPRAGLLNTLRPGGGVFYPLLIRLFFKLESSSSLSTSSIVGAVGVVGGYRFRVGLYCFLVGVYCEWVGLIVLIVGLIVLIVGLIVLFVNGIVYPLKICE